MWDEPGWYYELMLWAPVDPETNPSTQGVIQPDRDG